MGNLSLKSDFQLQEPMKQIYYLNLSIELKNHNTINMLFKKKKKKQQNNSLKEMLKIDL